MAGAGTPVLVCSTCRSTSTSSDVAGKTSVRSGQHIGGATSSMLRIASLLITGLLRTTSSRVRMQREPLGFPSLRGNLFQPDTAGHRTQIRGSMLLLGLARLIGYRNAVRYDRMFSFVLRCHSVARRHVRDSKQEVGLTGNPLHADVPCLSPDAWYPQTRDSLFQ